ncbi:hypothetical protein CPB85DRAFT_1262063 [Mucidula mucida]|nr:hypothetical protein CPB85DRAFT_1262063 [Mucidula mucida]
MVEGRAHSLRAWSSGWTSLYRSPENIAKTRSVARNIAGLTFTPHSVNPAGLKEPRTLRRHHFHFKTVFGVYIFGNITASQPMQREKQQKVGTTKRHKSSVRELEKTHQRMMIESGKKFLTSPQNPFQIHVTIFSHFSTVSPLRSPGLQRSWRSETNDYKAKLPWLSTRQLECGWLPEWMQSEIKTIEAIHNKVKAVIKSNVASQDSTSASRTRFLHSGVLDESATLSTTSFKTPPSVTRIIVRLRLHREKVLFIFVALKFDWNLPPDVLPVLILFLICTPLICSTSVSTAAFGGIVAYKPPRQTYFGLTAYRKLRIAAAVSSGYSPLRPRCGLLTAACTTASGFKCATLNFNLNLTGYDGQADIFAPSADYYLRYLSPHSRPGKVNVHLAINTAADKKYPLRYQCIQEDGDHVYEKENQKRLRSVIRTLESMSLVSPGGYCILSTGYFPRTSSNSTNSSMCPPALQRLQETWSDLDAALNLPDTNSDGDWRTGCAFTPTFRVYASRGVLDPDLSMTRGFLGPVTCLECSQSYLDCRGTAHFASRSTVCISTAKTQSGLVPETVPVRWILETLYERKRYKLYAFREEASTFLQVDVKRSCVAAE